MWFYPKIAEFVIKRSVNKYEFIRFSFKRMQYTNRYIYGMRCKSIYWYLFPPNIRFTRTLSLLYTMRACKNWDPIELCKYGTQFLRARSV